MNFLFNACVMAMILINVLAGGLDGALMANGVLSGVPALALRCWPWTATLRLEPRATAAKA